jgi:hypothetical protein
MKKFLFITVLLFIGIIVSAIYLYSQFSYLPEWYDKKDDTEPEKKEVVIEKNIETIKSELVYEKKSVITEDELTRMMINKFHEIAGENKDGFIRLVRSKVYKDKVQLQAVVNLEEIPEEMLPRKYQKEMDELLKFFPKSNRKNFYVELEGKPVRNEDRLILDKDATIKFGKIKYSLSSILEQVSGKNLQHIGVNLEKLPFRDFRLEEGQIVLIK